MSFDARVYRVLIASPSDVGPERDIVARVIQDWNDTHSADRGVALLPVRWETHATPDFGRPPQQIINTQIVDNCDLLIGVFWTRVGTPTETAESGTLEEIERVAAQNKPVMLYFSKAKRDPDDINLEQLQKLRDFKENVKHNALIETFSDQVEFRDKLAKHLSVRVRELMANHPNILPGARDIVSPSTDIRLHFADALGHSAGAELVLGTQLIKVNDLESIPDYTGPSLTTQGLGVTPNPLSPLNKDYYRQQVKNYMTRASFRVLRFWLTNKGSIGARDIHIDLTFNSDIEINLRSSSEVFSVPNRTVRYLGSVLDFTQEEELPAQAASKSWASFLAVSALQPKREFSPKPTLALGVLKSGTVQIDAKIYADLLPMPQKQALRINVKVETVEISALDIMKKLQRPNELFT